MPVKKKDEHKTKEELIRELEGLRQQVADLNEIDKNRKQAEEALRESEARYASVLATISDAVIVADPDGTITMFNPGAEKLFQCTEEEALGTSISRICPEDRRPEQAGLLRKVRETGTVQGIETERLTADGRRVSVEMVLDLRTDNQGSPVAISAALRDITGRKQAEEKLKKQQYYLAKAQEVAHLGNWSLELSTGRFSVSDEVARIYGINPQQFKPNLQSVMPMLHPDDVESIQRLLEDLCRETSSGEGEHGHRIIRPDGEIRFVHERYKVEYGSDNTPIRIFGTIQDVTERMRAEQRSLKDLEEKEVMLKEIHHRVKNNLNVITSLLNLQMNEIHSKEQAVTAFEESRDRIYSMALVHDQLYKTDDLAGIEFNEYIKHLVKKLDRIYNHQNKIAVTYDLDTIFLDINKAVPCGLILNELITNTFKHAFCGKETGNIFISFKKNRNKQFRLVVKDDGVGFPKHVDIEEPKSLGLQLVRILTAQLEGKLSMTKRKGMTFRIQFPGV